MEKRNSALNLTVKGHHGIIKIAADEYKRQRRGVQSDLVVLWNNYTH